MTTFKLSALTFCMAFATFVYASPSLADGSQVTTKKGDQMFKKPSSDDLKKTLTPLQYDVTQKNGTEAPYQNAYWDNHEDGIYVDAVSGEPLFSSLDKYDSGTGWPSFTKPIDQKNIVKKADNSMFNERTEVRSRSGDSHLGHVFDDGPKDKGGQRFCMNSAAMRFVPVADLEKEGYGQYKSLFAGRASARATPAKKN